MTPFLNFKPIYQERVWGGRHLESYLGRKLPGNAPIGESWDVVDRPEAQSIVVVGDQAVVEQLKEFGRISTIDLRIDYVEPANADAFIATAEESAFMWKKRTPSESEFSMSMRWA